MILLQYSATIPLFLVQICFHVGQETEKYRAVLVLREMEGLDIAEISQITGTQAATVRWRLHRARALFRDRWRLAVGEE